MLLHLELVLDSGKEKIFKSLEKIFKCFLVIEKFHPNRTCLCWPLVDRKTQENATAACWSCYRFTLSFPLNSFKGHSRLNVIQARMAQPRGLLDQQHSKAFDFWWKAWPWNYPRPCCYGNTVPDSANLINAWTSSEISPSLERTPMIHNSRCKSPRLHLISYIIFSQPWIMASIELLLVLSEMMPF